MHLTSDVSTDHKTKQQLDELAGRLVSGYNNPIKQHLQKHSPEKTKELLWKHLEKSLREPNKKNPNIDEVLALAKNKLFALIDLRALELKPKKKK